MSRIGDALVSLFLGLVLVLIVAVLLLVATFCWWLAYAAIHLGLGGTFAVLCLCVLCICVYGVGRVLLHIGECVRDVWHAEQWT